MSKGKFLKKQKVSTGKKVGRVFLVLLLVLLILIGAVFALPIFTVRATILCR